VSTPSPDDDVVTAETVMSSPVITVSAGQSLWDAWTAVSSCGVRHVVVTVRDRCVGVVDDRRLVAAWPQDPVTCSTHRCGPPSITGQRAFCRMRLSLASPRS
jgi:signal-transduction protein with cAMP-binding, CBS, and nucleotidyltransferase domain